MSYLITYVRGKGNAPRTIATNYDEPSARATAEAMAALSSRVTLTELDGEGIPSILARWENGSHKRSVPQVTIPDAEPVTIEGEVMDDTADAETDSDIAEAAAADEGETYNAYCVKCKAKRDFHGHVEETANGRRMAKGLCPVCGTKVNAILKNVPLSEDFHTPDDEPEETADEPDEQPQDESEADEGAETPEAADVTAEVITEAIVESVPEGTTLPEVADAVAEAAVEFSHAAEEAIAEKPVPAKRTRAPRKTTAKAAKAAKATATETVSDDDVERVTKLQVATCPQCQRRVPFKIAGSTNLRYFMNHPDEKGSGSNCKGSLGNVEDSMLTVS